MSPALARLLDNERFLTRLLFILGQPTKEMIDTGKTSIGESVVAEYIGSTAPQDIFASMVKIALEQAERG